VHHENFGVTDIIVGVVLAVMFYVAGRVTSGTGGTEPREPKAAAEYRRRRREAMRRAGPRFAAVILLVFVGSGLIVLFA
jgi:hypothetical protein